MKKTYIIPEVEIHDISVEGLIAASPDVTMGEGKKGAGSFEVKGQGNTQSYDVWDDDWQKQ